MVSHDAETHIHGFVIAIRAAGQLLGGFDDREDLVGLIDVLLTLHQIGKTLQAAPVSMFLFSSSPTMCRSVLDLTLSTS